jgi:hypothetical protein
MHTNAALWVKINQAVDFLKKVRDFSVFKLTAFSISL